MEALGFNLKYFLFQLTDFVLVFLILRKLLHVPLTSYIEKRRETIAKGLENAEKMEAALAQTEERQQQILEDARREGRSLLEQTRQEAQKLTAKLEEEAQAAAAKVLEDAEREIEFQRAEMRRELRAELAQMVVLATEKVLGETISSAEKREKITTLTKEISHGN